MISPGRYVVSSSRVSDTIIEVSDDRFTTVGYIYDGTPRVVGRVCGWGSVSNLPRDIALTKFKATNYPVIPDSSNN